MIVLSEAIHLPLMTRNSLMSGSIWRTAQSVEGRSFSNILTKKLLCLEIQAINVAMCVRIDKNELVVAVDIIEHNHHHHQSLMK